ncbi:MAG: hypothetical protein JKY94_04970 [Rhodobacteraceae bacterium]|nr:hypothetical protein [Paracoccaceae bacterium]
MRAVYAAIALCAVAACTPGIPDSGAGVGFDNSVEAQRAREAALEYGTTLNGQPLVPPTVISPETLSTVPVATPITSQPLSATGTPTGSGADIAAETAAALSAANSNSGQAPLQASPSNPAPVRLSNPGISDENNFGSVADERSISDDAERIANSRQQRQQIQPTALPKRSGSSQPNIVAYALQTDNPRGTRLYSRTGISLASKSNRNCAKFVSPDQAQSAFLANGGPQKDRQALDPDGDGYACTWDPSPFRQAVKN